MSRSILNFYCLESDTSQITSLRKSAKLSSNMKLRADGRQGNKKKKSIPGLSAVILESKINATVGQGHISSSNACTRRGWTEVDARPVCLSQFVHNYTTFQTKQITDISFSVSFFFFLVFLN